MCTLFPGHKWIALQCLHIGTMVINIEYNQLDQLIPAHGYPDGDTYCEIGLEREMLHKPFSVPEGAM